MSVRVSRLLHAGYLFESGGSKIAFDPIFENPFSRNCHAFPSVTFDQDKIKKLKFDAIFISHFHDDHCSLESLNLIDRSTPIYMFCIFEDMFLMLRELGFLKVYSLKLESKIEIGPFAITPYPALDVDVDCIFHIQAADLHILNVVDSWIDPETLKKLELIPRWDLVLWPFQTMRELEVLAPSRVEITPVALPFEWLDQIKILNPKIIVPSSCQFQQESWSWYNKALFPISYKFFESQMNAIIPQSKFLRLNPSRSIILTEMGSQETQALDWIVPQGPQDVDYIYDPEVIPPSTAAIAQRFDALAEFQTDLVLNYCRSELLKKYSSLEGPHDEYFDRPLIWRLSVFDHLGKSRDFFYQIHKNKISIEKPTEEIGWSTEIPLAKFYGALEQGESLTSLYMRINEGPFAAEIEVRVARADIIEDPLIRCLFSENFGAYQKAQLKRLKIIF